MTKKAKDSPNILILMTDQMTGTLFADGPASFLHTPALNQIAANATRFTNTYCASPLCAPSRASFMSGLPVSQTGVYDNAAEFVSSIPTFPHYLRRQGYKTVLAGKMHFVGPDQLHGFEERMTTDVYPADFGWTPDWTKPDERIDWWYHNLGSVTGAGVAEMSNQMEYDDEVAHFAAQRLYDFARHDEQPFCLTVSFTHPHDPYTMRQRFWDLYPNAPLPTNSVAAEDAHSIRLQRANDAPRFNITEDNVFRARRAYFAAISYLDEKIANLLQVLRDCRMHENTVVIFCADHGDMLGERGLWFKMSLYEGSVRVPLMISAPFIAPRTIHTPVSLLDILPTIADMGGTPLADIKTSGRSLLPLMQGDDVSVPVFAEYAAEGSIAPMIMIRDGDYKYVECPADPPQLFNVATDPGELENLAQKEPQRVAAFAAAVKQHYNLDDYTRAVLQSQARRLAVYPALRNGEYYPWDFQPLQRASERYMRNHKDLNVLEENARFPRGE